MRRANAGELSILEYKRGVIRLSLPHWPFRYGRVNCYNSRNMLGNAERRGVCVCVCVCGIFATKENLVEASGIE